MSPLFLLGIRIVYKTSGLTQGQGSRSAGAKKMWRFGSIQVKRKIKNDKRIFDMRFVFQWTILICSNDFGCHIVFLFSGGFYFR